MNGNLVKCSEKLGDKIYFTLLIATPFTTEKVKSCPLKKVFLASLPSQPSTITSSKGLKTETHKWNKNPNAIRGPLKALISTEF